MHMIINSMEVSIMQYRNLSRFFMHKFHTSLLIILFWLTSGNAQPTIFWSQNIGGTLDEQGNCVRQTDDGGFIVTGKSGPPGTGAPDLVLIKTDYQGTTEWTQMYGGHQGDCGYWVEQTNDGGYIIVGSADEGMYELYGDLYVLRTDALGDTIWTRKYNWGEIDRGFGVVETEEGDFVIAGIYDGAFTAPNGDVFLMKLDSDGGTLWLQTYNYHGRDCGYALAQTDDGGFIISGATNEDPYAPYGTIFIIKTDGDGNTLWMNEYGNGLGLSVLQASDGNYVVGGWTGGPVYGSEDLFMLKVDPDGLEIWKDFWGTPNSDSGHGVVESTDGGYLLVGRAFDAWVICHELYMVRTDTEGNTIGTWTYSGGSYDHASCVTRTQDGNYVLTGSTVGLGYGDILLLHLDDNLGSVVVKLTPHEQPIQIPASGGSFDYDFELANNSDTNYTVDVLLYAVRDWYLGSYNAAFRTGISLPSGETITRNDLSQRIPSSLPGDGYNYCAWITDSNTQQLLSLDCFPFEKMETGGDGLAEADWLLMGWDIKTESVAGSNLVELNSASPNPFNPSTLISYKLPAMSCISLNVYDISGRLVSELANGWRDAGVHEVTFDASGLTSGIYIYRLKSGDHTVSGKMVLMK
ncbi:hypothetical protein CEE37_10320 [candidate division LCP-89 bacterium B3_LCP]|uniref:Secretion system C-terminal sorting domain-containing protein n=1 Tax=candidate division LCP-89 bacterium B3_LCP TaxID=2012998 RepID=A0A532UYU0_UNCL8|nr:MAG: hypothetical protein CEE37_10320 [candidate division LCP-89 bacterium B3_LCP]